MWAISPIQTGMESVVITEYILRIALLVQN